MKASERDEFLAAVMELKSTVANPSAPIEQQINIYDQFVADHRGCLSVTVPNGSTTNMGHQGPGFGPWHRKYLLEFERALQEVSGNSDIGLPYWDWTDHERTESKLFKSKFLGSRSGVIKTGYFAFDKPGTGENTTSRPDWWPNELDGWHIRPSLAHTFGTTLRRGIDNRSLAIEEDINRLMSRVVYEDTGSAPERDPVTNLPVIVPLGFRNRLERGPRLHNFGHGWVGGHMGHPLTSPNDLIFFLHHCNIDRLWAQWQEDGHEGDAFYPDEHSGEDEGHKINDSMWPWVGNEGGYVPNSVPLDIVLTDYSGDPSISPADVMDHRTLGYEYN